jgi:sugar lactone lactonase YvrE
LNSLVTHADLSAHATGHANDMVVDGQGRAYVGNFGFDLMSGSPLETASLHRVDPDGTATEVADDLWFPNGAVIACAAPDFFEEARKAAREGRLLATRVAVPAA